MISFCNFYENQVAHFISSFFAANIVEIKAPRANLFPYMKDIIFVNASNLATFRLPYVLAIR
jgi:hypothetical protein